MLAKSCNCISYYLVLDRLRLLLLLFLLLLQLLLPFNSVKVRKGQADAQESTVEIGMTL